MFTGDQAQVQPRTDPAAPVKREPALISTSSTATVRLMAGGGASSAEDDEPRGEPEDEQDVLR
ncbi:MAG: hypothetical protein AVDCRST_MAG22-1808 [uncultured Rubrobacteraceae bacterium]|uniref:Uncharacterized protein n=1 Tax=uncultured Rubrobacteraceae bacterium TaxID=349277 RepID=A0A6J4PDX1_9ACTN|nr:MAG: hypothetical protein AVDCRST_MAG22-1808 [uncultured Rubrobacteraceae bacterium]